MIYRLYTNEEWKRIFGTPLLYIDTYDDTGIWYIHKERPGNFSSPVGKINFKRGKITYDNIVVGYVKEQDDVIEIYNTQSSKPIYYIENNKIYSYDEYKTIFGSPSAHLKSDDNSNISSGKKKSSKAKTESVNAGALGGLIAMIPVVAFGIAFFIIASTVFFYFIKAIIMPAPTADLMEEQILFYIIWIVTSALLIRKPGIKSNYFASVYIRTIIIVTLAATVVVEGFNITSIIAGLIMGVVGGLFFLLIIRTIYKVISKLKKARY